jgi:Fe-S-cluster-containing hydrogenase component 2
VNDSPLLSLQRGTWFKLICGASFHHLPAIRSLALAYSLAGADCIDVAADSGVIHAVLEAIALAESLAAHSDRPLGMQARPWLMVSLNDGSDPHFRKAHFDPRHCPPDCARPCEKVCPALAIRLPVAGNEGVIQDRCYGCGRCEPVCPQGLIDTVNHTLDPGEVVDLLQRYPIDALEIHTQVGHFEHFRQLWAQLSPRIHHLRLLAISCPDHPEAIAYLQSLAPLVASFPGAILWQSDGRPMSGDIGKGTTHTTIKYGQRVLRAGLPGYVQLAGGTNAHTITLLKEKRLIGAIAGIAYGSYARHQLQDLLEAQAAKFPTIRYLEEDTDLLWQAVAQARALIAPLKQAQSHDAYAL